MEYMGSVGTGGSTHCTLLFSHTSHSGEMEACSMFRSMSNENTFFMLNPTCLLKLATYRTAIDQSLITMNSVSNLT